MPQRKPTRLKGFDYSTPGAYFITICTQNRACVLSSIADTGKVVLSEAGRVLEFQIQTVMNRYPSAMIDKYVIMPNHVHMILRIKAAGGSTAVDIVRWIKSVTRHHIGAGLFQRSFHDHVIRTESDYRMIWEYIDTNPLKWAQDCFYQPEGSYFKANPAPEKGVPSPCGE